MDLRVITALLLVAASALAYPVGTADVTFVDPDRGDRPVPVDLYYPATADGAGQPVAAPPMGGFAAVVFGHGYQLTAGLYAWLGQGLAADGHVVAIPRTGGELFPSHAEFGLDLAFVSRALRAAGDDPASPFFGLMSDRAAVAGHSMGGGCSMLAAAGDPTVTAVANLAAAETNPSAIAVCPQIDRPALIFAGGNDCVTPPADHQIPMYQALDDGWRTLVTMDGASHCQWNAYSFICALGESCSAGISRTAQQEATLQVLRPWLDAVLRDGDAAAFQDVLDTTAGITYEQAGQVTAAPAPAGGGLQLAVDGPNPFRAALGLRLAAAAGQPASVDVFDVAGRRVRTLATSVAVTDGPVALRWDGRGDDGRRAPAGVYLVRARTGVATAWLRVTRLR
jgi:hypothetical protein